MAQITELIILFCESAGSFAELGSFASVEEVAKRLLVIIRDYYDKEDSFITLGPITNLRNNHAFSVFVIEDAVIGIINGSHDNLNLDALKMEMEQPIRLRLEKTREPTTFNPERAGHLIKLVVGLIQEYGALKLPELTDTFNMLGVYIPVDRLKAFLLCAKTVGWIDTRKTGFDEFFVALDGEDAANFSLPEDTKVKNRRRRRLIIRDYWEENDPPRFRAITKLPGEVGHE